MIVDVQLAVLAETEGWERDLRTAALVHHLYGFGLEWDEAVEEIEARDPPKAEWDELGHRLVFRARAIVNGGTGS